MQPLQVTKSFEAKRKEIEKRIDEGYTYLELGSEFKMDKRLTKYMESLTAQARERGNTININK